MTQTDVISLFAAVRAKADAEGVFGPCEQSETMVSCAAAASAAPAFYRLRHDTEGWQVELVTADRWLSESIEADLMHLGDSIESLIEEEMVDLGGPAGEPVVKHYRSDDMFYTFRTPLDNEIDADAAVRWLFAYEAAFRELGDMTADEDDDDE